MRRALLVLVCLTAFAFTGCGSDEPISPALNPTQPTGPSLTDQQVAQGRAQCEDSAMKLPAGDVRNQALAACDDFK